MAAVFLVARLPNREISLRVLTAGAALCLHYADYARGLALMNGFLCTRFTSPFPVRTSSSLLPPLSFISSTQQRWPSNWCFDNSVFRDFSFFLITSLTERLIDSPLDVLGRVSLPEVYVTDPPSARRGHAVWHSGCFVQTLRYSHIPWKSRRMMQWQMQNVFLKWKKRRRTWWV